MHNQNQREGILVEKVIRGIIKLTESTWVTSRELADAMGSESVHSAQVLLRVLTECGFVIKREGYSYTLLKVPSRLKSLDSYYWIRPEEMEPLSELVAEMGCRTPQTAMLLKRILTLCGSTSAGKVIAKSEPARSWALLRKAVKDKRQVVLHDYESPHSGTTANRLVEPYDFTTNYREVVCYDIERQGERHFMLDRIRGGVDLLEQHWMFEDQHTKYSEDAFHMSGSKTIAVKLRLSLRAKLLLEEEYPLSQRHIKAEGDHWEYADHVARVEGIGRFVMGLPGEVEVIKGPELKAYVAEKLQLVLKQIEGWKQA